MGRLGLAVVLSVAVAHADERPQPELGKGPTAVPAVPAFDMLMPSANAMGVQQVRVARRSVDGKPVVVRGYVTFVYDCVEANLEPFKTRAQIEKDVAADPTKCEPAKLYLGDAKTTPKEFSLPVDLSGWKVGDYVEVAGTFRVDHIELAKAMKVKPEVGTRVALPAPHAVAALPAPKPLRASPPPGQKMKAIVAVMQTARKHAEWLQWKEAQIEYQRVVATWDAHDVAWYELGHVFEVPGMVVQAAEAYGRAFALVPAQPVYAYAYGRMLWLREYYVARVAEAGRTKVHEEYVQLPPNHAKLNLDRAQQTLEYAVTLAPEQWRAHDALGSIALANEEYKLAAEAFTRAIARGPVEYDAYRNLAQLYRAWGYENEAIAVAQAWMKLRAPDDSHERLFEIAAEAYEATGDLKKAIEMLTIVLAHPARGASNAAFNRARLYVATKQWDKARLDLALFPTHNKVRMRDVNVLLAKIPAAKKKR